MSHCPTCRCQDKKVLESKYTSDMWPTRGRNPAFVPLDQCVECGAELPNCHLAIHFHEKLLGKQKMHIVLHDHPGKKCIPIR